MATDDADTTRPRGSRENRIHMMLSDEEMTVIDDWRFKNRVATRSEAIRRLCRIAMYTEADIWDAGIQGGQILERTGKMFEQLSALPDEEKDNPLFDWLEEIIPELSKNIFGLIKLGNVIKEMREGSRFDDAVKAADKAVAGFDGLIEKVTAPFDPTDEEANQ